MSIHSANNSEKELLSYMLAAPAGEIENMIPSTVAECAKFIGLSENEPYSYRPHYAMVVAKARREWAQAMVAEAMGCGNVRN